jgi:TPP-dependent 2-oxoacid decarboxylase
MDTPDILIPSQRLKSPLDTEIRNDGLQGEEDKIVDRIVSLMKDAKSPAILVDVLARRYGLKEEIVELLKITNLPVSLLQCLLRLHRDLGPLSTAQYRILTLTAGIYHTSFQGSH